MDLGTETATASAHQIGCAPPRSRWNSDDGKSAGSHGRSDDKQPSDRPEFAPPNHFHAFDIEAGNPPERTVSRSRCCRRRISCNIRRCLKRLCGTREQSQQRSGTLASIPSSPKHIFTLSRIKTITSLVFDTTPGLHYIRLDLGEAPIYAGSGSYGEVKIFKRANIAV
nr:tegument serine/threonine protein kinase [iBAC vector pMeHV1-C7]AKQ48714.1 tegument serine/threonine protein kinase [iBAC vector pMeHV1-C9]AKQ48786.1 tegument serine/threonine protein kinase [iBAC vector pMeHV1-C10]AKQ48858.1 tegument serine/threonine protein kinase [iBAC vector pMeHV1-C17]